MPNTKSAERRARSSARRQTHNKAIKQRLGTLEKKYTTLVGSGNKAEATAMLKSMASALDKAAKVGVIHQAKASRKKSRLTLQLNKVK